MAEYWQDVLSRANASNGIWQTFNPGLKVGKLTLPLHQADAAQLPVTHAAKVAQEGVVDAARDARDANYALIKELAVRVPRAVEAVLTSESTLFNNIDLLRNTKMESMAEIVTRGTDVHALWLEANAERAAQTPAETPLVVGGKTVAMLAAALEAVQGLNTVVTVAEGELSKKRSAHRALTDKVDHNNKRWYLAWLAEYLPGTPEHDALTLIDTGSSGGGGSTPPPPPPLALPTAPLNVVLTTGAEGSGAAGISWDNPPAGQGVTGFNIYRDGVFLMTAGGPTTLDGFTPGEALSITVAAINATGEGPQSEPVTGTAG